MHHLPTQMMVRSSMRTAARKPARSSDWDKGQAGSISRARGRDGGALLHRRSSTAPCTRVSSPAADVERERHATMNATQMLDAIAMKERRRNGPAWRAFGRRSAVDAQVHVDGQLLPAVPTSCSVWHCVREKGNCCVLFCNSRGSRFAFLFAATAPRAA